MLGRMAAAALASGIAFPAAADIEQVRADGGVDEVMKRIEVAVATAGATIFATVDHGGGARSVGSDIGDSQLIIFGSPSIGTPVIAADPLAGLVLPLKILVYSDGQGQTWIAYEEVDAMLEDLEVDDGAEYVEQMETVLTGFVEAGRT